MKKIQDIAGFVFIATVIVLSAVSILGVWEFFGRDVITKSFETFGLLALVAVIVMTAGKFVGNKPDSEMPTVEVPNPIFKTIRKAVVMFLIVIASLLALVGVLAIWDVIEDREVLFKVLGSLGILAFGSLIAVITCLGREGGSNKPRAIV